MSLFGRNIESCYNCLVQFRAGKMTRRGNMVYPDKRRGLVFLHQTNDSLMHFCWKDRGTGLVEEDMIIFPGDAEFKRVPQCTTGRVFILKFTYSNSRHFYWMQEPKTDKDNEYCAKVNEYLNNPPKIDSPQSSSMEVRTYNLSDIQSFLSNLNRQEFLELIISIGIAQNLSSLLHDSQPSSSQSTVSVTEPATDAISSAHTTSLTELTTNSANQSQVQLSDVQNMLSELDISEEYTSDLSSASRLEALQPLLDNQELMDRLKSLFPVASEDVAVSNDAYSTNEFQKAVRVFSEALQSGQLGQLMEEFGFAQDLIDAANSGDMETFLTALKKSNETQINKQQIDESNKDNDDD